MSRSTARPQYLRSFELDDIEIVRSGDGRTVRAYAATFDRAYEVRDSMGHYFEAITRTAFDQTLARGVSQVQCLFNHGMTIHHTPSEKFSMPLGTPLEIKPDGRGLLTVTRYAQTETADEVLELVRSGAIKSQSFRGPIYDSRPPARHQSGLALIQRTDLGLRDYGPATFAVNPDAEIVSVRSVLLDEIRDMTPQERADLLAAAAALDPAPTEVEPITPVVADQPSAEGGDAVVAEGINDNGLAAARDAQWRRRLGA